MKLKKRISLLVTLLVLAGAGYGGYLYYNQPPKITFLKAQVSRGTVEAVISATGTLAATRLVPVGSRVSGNVVKMYADFNTPVKKDQLLAEIDPSTFQNTVDQRKAALDSANTQRLQATVAERKADVDVRNAETSIASAQAGVARSKSQEVEALRKYNLQKSLVDQGIASKDSLDQAKATYDQAVLSTATSDAQLKTAQASLEATKAQREVTATQTITAESQIVQAQGQLTDAELNLGFTKILSPVDGIVITRKLNEGETVQASTTTPQLFEIAQDLTKMELDTNIDESDIARVQIGQIANFGVDAFPGQQFMGEVIQIRRGAVNVSNVISYTVVVSVDNSDLRLFPGMTANTRLVVDRLESTLRIPSSALRFRPPAELTVVGDVGKGKGKGNKDGAFKDGGDTKATDTKAPDAAPKQTSKADTKAPEALVAKADTTKGDTGDGTAVKGRNRKGNGDGTGGFDRSQFKGKGGGNFDPSQFQGKGGRNGGSNAGGGGRNGGGGRGGDAALAAGRGGRAGGRPVNQTQTVYRLNDKNELEAVRIRTGISDGNFIALLSTNLKEGDELVTAVDGLPSAANANKGNNNNNNNFNNNGFPGGGNKGGGGGNRGGFGF